MEDDKSNAEGRRHLVVYGMTKIAEKRRQIKGTIKMGSGKTETALR